MYPAALKRHIAMQKTRHSSNLTVQGTSTLQKDKASENWHFSGQKTTINHSIEKELSRPLNISHLQNKNSFR